MRLGTLTSLSTVSPLKTSLPPFLNSNNKGNSGGTHGKRQSYYIKAYNNNMLLLSTYYVVLGCFDVDSLTESSASCERSAAVQTGPGVWAPAQGPGGWKQEGGGSHAVL